MLVVACEQPIVFLVTNACNCLGMLAPIWILERFNSGVFYVELACGNANIVHAPLFTTAFPLRCTQRFDWQLGVVHFLDSLQPRWSNLTTNQSRGHPTDPYPPSYRAFSPCYSLSHHSAHPNALHAWSDHHHHHYRTLHDRLLPAATLPAIDVCCHCDSYDSSNGNGNQTSIRRNIVEHCDATDHFLMHVLFDGIIYA